MKKFLTLFVLATLLGGCSLHTRSGSIVLDPDRGGPSSGGGKFCPPGQAKKGNC